MPHGFTWLRDLRALGTDAARSRARALVSEFMDTEPLDPAGTAPDVTGARLAAWLGHYDFFAASADDDFRQRLMSRLVMDARSLSAALPAERLDGRALTALKGLLAASVAMPDHAGHLPRVLKFLTPEIGRQILPDGCHVERSPAAHLAALQDLTEIRALLQAAGAEPPPELLLGAIENAAAAMRALRHGDGGLALFNGTKEDLASLIDLVLAQAGRARGAIVVLERERAATASPPANRCCSWMPARPPPPGLDRFAHAGTLGFEFSVGQGAPDRQLRRRPRRRRRVARRAAQHRRAFHPDHRRRLLLGNPRKRPRPPAGPGRMPSARNAGGAHWLEASHDGWGKLFGAMHHRRLGLSESGEELHGEDLIEAEQPQPFTIRFHLHPNVTASLQQDNGAVLLRTPGGQGFRLRAEGAPILMEESVYFGHAEPRRAEQMVLAGHQDGPQHVKWSITRI